eukprot:365235-Chlamydomonas_euryale.AAC.2
MGRHRAHRVHQVLQLQPELRADAPQTQGMFVLVWLGADGHSDRRFDATLSTRRQTVHTKRFTPSGSHQTRFSLGRLDEGRSSRHLISRAGGRAGGRAGSGFRAAPDHSPSSQPPPTCPSTPNTAPAQSHSCCWQRRQQRRRARSRSVRGAPSLASAASRPGCSRRVAVQAALAPATQPVRYQPSQVPRTPHRQGAHGAAWIAASAVAVVRRTAAQRAPPAAERRNCPAAPTALRSRAPCSCP